MTLRVLVADDQSMVRAGFRMLLGNEPDIEVVAEASNGLEAVDKAKRYRQPSSSWTFACPNSTGWKPQGASSPATTPHESSSSPRSISMSTSNEALRAGASGFVLKDDPAEQLLDAIRIVARGDALLSPTITKRVINQFVRIPHPTAPKAINNLTDREFDVFRLIARGLSNAEIGQQLYISDATVKTHITHILQKLNLRDRVQAVVLAYESGVRDTGR